MTRLKKTSRAELTPHRIKPTLIYSGYLCPKAARCLRFKDAQDFHRRMVSHPGARPGNVVFQSPTINANGYCVYFIEAPSGLVSIAKNKKADLPSRVDLLICK